MTHKINHHACLVQMRLPETELGWAELVPQKVLALRHDLVQSSPRMDILLLVPDTFHPKPWAPCSEIGRQGALNLMVSEGLHRKRGAQPPCWREEGDFLGGHHMDIIFQGFEDVCLP